MASPGPQTATAARRWAARVAVVVGGVGAASAAAWVLSTATAGAAQVDPVDPGAAVGQIAKTAGEALQDTVDRVGKALRNTGPHIERPQPSQPGPPASDEQTSEPAPVVEPRADDPEPPLGGAAQDAMATVDDFLSRLLGGGEQPPWPSEPVEPPACAPEFQDFCERIGEWFAPKPGDLVPGIPPVDDLPLPDTGTDELPALPGTSPSTVTKPIVSAGAAQAVEALTETAAVSSISPRGDPRHTDFPGGGSALSLPGMPALAAPGSGATATGHADGAPLAITAAQAAAAASSAGSALAHHTPGSSSRGGQPGVTPD